MEKLNNLKIKIFADGADFETIKILNKKNYIKGFTTNPSLMKKAGVKDYKSFALELLKNVDEKPISFEVFSDDILEMQKQAEEIATWGKNVNVKIPITNTKKQSTLEIIEKLSSKGIICNITAIFTINQLRGVVDVLDKSTPAILSIFAGRIADTGVDPASYIKFAKDLVEDKKLTEILWASTRETFSIFEAQRIGCDIITVPHEILNKLDLLGKNLDEYSLETVKQFYKDAVSSNFKL